MRVLVDCRYIQVGRADGISRYTRGLVRALDRCHPVELLVSDPGQRQGLPDRPWHQINSPTSPAEPFVARRINRIGADVVFSPMQTMGSLGRRFALVLTVHDLIYYRYRTPPPWLAAPVRLLWRLYHLSWWPQRLLLDRADAVVTVSATTARLLARHRLTRRPVTVVPDATDFHPSPTTPPRTRPGGVCRLVYAGSFMPYKNVETLVAAVSRLPGYELHLLSPAPPEVRARLTATTGSERLVFHDGAGDEDYRALLDSAVALLSASRDEGFGLPVLEAMARGTPVVVSDIPAFREVAGPGALFVDPDDAAGFARAVRHLEDPAQWARRSAAARDQAAEQTWARAAESLLTVLRKAAADIHADAVDVTVTPGRGVNACVRGGT